MRQIDVKYRELANRILSDGCEYEGRHGPMIGLVGASLSIDIGDDFPVIASKNVNWRAAFYETCWFLSGDRSLCELNEYTSIWKPWSKLKYVAYGEQWRSWFVSHPVYAWESVDQLRNAIDVLKKDPGSRRALVSAWNAEVTGDADLPPCHFAHQYLIRDGRLHLIVYQRSWDVAVGCPFNLCNYGLIGHLVANELRIPLGTLTFHVGDAHIYKSHVEAIKGQIERHTQIEPVRLHLDRELTIDSISYADVADGRVYLDGYAPADPIKYDIYI